MTLKDAMTKRHMVRQYIAKPISQDVIEKLNERVDSNNKKYGLSIKLMTSDSSAFSAIIKVLLARGVKNFFIMCGNDEKDLDEKCGYCGADIMLYAQTLGLNTWWAGGTFNHKATAAKVDGKKVIGIIAVGYGKTQGVPHKTKTLSEVSYYKGSTPFWFTEGVNAALLAPTALARQSFFIKGEENVVSITCDNGVFSGADKGLVKYHFELGAGKENFIWK